MLSRVADSIYWMSRYIERAENVARFIDVTLNLMLDMPVGSVQQWQPLVDTTGDAKEFADRYGVATQQRVIQFLTHDPDNPNSIRSCLRAARENARSVREVISSEMWEQLNEFYLMVDSTAFDANSLSDPQHLFAIVKMSSHEFAGVTDATMTHNEGWHFCRLGRHLERADKTSRILDVKYFLLLPTAADVGTTYEDIQWAAVLRSASAFEMYRKRHGRMHPERIVEFLLLDREFPRAIQCCLMAARGIDPRHFRHACGHVPQSRRATARRALLRARLRPGRRHHRRRPPRVPGPAANAAESCRRWRPRHFLCRSQPGHSDPQEVEDTPGDRLEATRRLFCQCPSTSLSAIEPATATTGPFSSRRRRSASGPRHTAGHRS